MDTGFTWVSDWRVLALGLIIGAGMVWVLVFMLRENAKDLDELEETIEEERKEDGQ